MPTGQLVSCHSNGDLLLAMWFILPEKYHSGERDFGERWMMPLCFCDGSHFYLEGLSVCFWQYNIRNNGICDRWCRGCAGGRCKLASGGIISV